MRVGGAVNNGNVQNTLEPSKWCMWVSPKRVVLHSSRSLLPYNSLHTSYWPYTSLSCPQSVGKRVGIGLKHGKVQNTLEPLLWCMWVSPERVVLHSSRSLLPYNSLHTSYWPYTSLSCPQSVGKRVGIGLKHGNVQNTLEPLLWCMWVSPKRVVLHSSRGLLPYNSLHTTYWPYTSLPCTQGVGMRVGGAVNNGKVQNTLGPSKWCMWVSPKRVVLHSYHGLFPNNSLHTTYWPYISLSCTQSVGMRVGGAVNNGKVQNTLEPLNGSCGCHQVMLYCTRLMVSCHTTLYIQPIGHTYHSHVPKVWGRRVGGAVNNGKVQNTLEPSKWCRWVSPNTVVLHSSHGRLPYKSLHTSYWPYISLSCTQSVGKRVGGAVNNGKVQNTLGPSKWACGCHQILLYCTHLMVFRQTTLYIQPIGHTHHSHVLKMWGRELWEL
jgi:hypothetical protein